tara:strand:- start:947 stop:1468 length:522 start_codon:yes stop_codon:yes gene_type:complete
MRSNLSHLKPPTSIALVLALTIPAMAQVTGEQDLEAAKAQAIPKAIEMTDSVARCNGVTLAVAARFAELPQGEAVGETMAQLVKPDFIDWVADIIEVPASRFQELQERTFLEIQSKIISPETDEERSIALNDVMQNDLGPCSDITMWAETQMMFVLAPFALGRHLEDQKREAP